MLTAMNATARTFADLNTLPSDRLLSDDELKAIITRIDLSVLENTRVDLQSLIAHIRLREQHVYALLGILYFIQFQLRDDAPHSPQAGRQMALEGATHMIAFFNSDRGAKGE